MRRQTTRPKAAMTRRQSVRLEGSPRQALMVHLTERPFNPDTLIYEEAFRISNPSQLALTRVRCGQCGGESSAWEWRIMTFYRYPFRDAVVVPEPGYTHCLQCCPCCGQCGYVDSGGMTILGSLAEEERR